jgi:predicted dehydrogenase
MSGPLPQPSRRDALRRSAALGGLWVLGGAGPRARAYAANESVGAAFVGVGGRGGANLGGMSEVEGVRVVGLCDVDRGHLAGAARKHPDAKAFADFRRMLDAVGRDADAVVVSTPDHTHATAAHAALLRDKHVYCEKPLTRAIHAARVLARTAAERKLATQMGNGGHSSEASRRAVEIVKAGLVGTVKEVHVWTDRPIWPQGLPKRPDPQPVPEGLDWDLWLGPAPDRPYSAAYHPFKWRGWWDFGTGALGDMACHLMDVPFWALDLRDPTSVEMVESEGANDETGPTSSVTRYAFPERDGRPALMMTWYEGGRLPPKELFDGAPVAKGGALIVGETGTLLTGRPTLLPESRFRDVALPPPTLARSPGHYADFVAAIRDPVGRPACSNFAYAAGLTETVLLGVLAQRARRKIEWDAKAMAVRNDSALDPWIRPVYRAGWTL